MKNERLIHYFIPDAMQNKLHPDYDQVRTVASGMIVGVLLLVLLPLPLLFFTPSVQGYYGLAGMGVVTLLLLKYFGIYRIPLILSLLSGYYVIIDDTLQSGGIVSPAVTTLYLLLLTGFWFNRKIGLVMIFLNIVALLIINSQIELVTEESLYAVVSHIVLTLFFGVFFWFVQQQHDTARRQIREQQLARIDLLNQAIKERTEELSMMRQNLAADFHDETGNMLSAITRQAGILKVRLGTRPDIQVIADNIIRNSEQLYASSKDFIWSINHNSDEVEEVFAYLTAFGQFFFNQFDIAFSVRSKLGVTDPMGNLPAFAARHIIYIFKELMTNTARHANAREVVLEKTVYHDRLSLCLVDDGNWKEPNPGQSHFGLRTIERRCNANAFKLTINKKENGTSIELEAPLRYLNVE